MSDGGTTALVGSSTTSASFGVGFGTSTAAGFCSITGCGAGIKGFGAGACGAGAPVVGPKAGFGAGCAG